MSKSAKAPVFDAEGYQVNLSVLNGTALPDLKQQLARLTKRERQQISAFIIRRGQETTTWKKEAARRLDEMAAGKKVSASKLRRQLSHA